MSDIKSSVESFKGLSIQAKISLILLSVCIIAACVCYFITVSKISTVNEKLNALNTEYEDVKTTIAKLKQQKNEITEEHVTNILSNASEAGKLVAEYQNEYAKVTADKYGSIKAKLAELADGRTDLSARWVLLNDENIKIEFNTVYDFSGNSVPSLWTITGKDGSFLGYVTATYYAGTETFGNVFVNLTRDFSDRVNGNNSGSSENNDNTIPLDDNMPHVNVW